MTTAHSALSLSFGRKRRPSPTEYAQRPAETLTCESTHGMTCWPWEGLYFPTPEPVSNPEAEVFNPELERFLSSIMSGE
jgi:hypothetical protein